MRTAILICALILACSSGSKRPAAEEPEAPAQAEESDGFTPEQKEALSELLDEDVTTGSDGGDEAAPASPGTSSSARPAP